MTNLTLALRTLSRTPFVTLVAILSLALGIGANAAIFSVFDQILLQALPVQDPDRLVSLSAPGPKPGTTSCNQSGSCAAVFSYPMFRDLERTQSAFTQLAAHRSFSANLAYRGQTLNADGTLVSGSYFPALGVRPSLGRLLGPEDDRTIGGHHVAVLSYAYWQMQLGGSPAVLNDTVIVNGQAMTIVGVAARGFRGVTLGQSPFVFVPITMRGVMVPGWTGFENRRSYWAYLFARLKPGVSAEQARTAINGPYRAIVNDVEAPLQQGMSDATMARFRAKEIAVDEGRRGQSSVLADAGAPLTMLLSITAIVLLIACANIANLLLARGATRAGEMAVRLSIGASRRQLLAQLLTESCVLAALGGIGGLLVARWTLAVLGAVLPGGAASTFEVALQPSTILYTAALSIGTGLLFGIFPALHGTRPDLAATLKGQAGQPAGSRAAARFRNALVTAQIALSMSLLVSAGLFLKSLTNVSRVDLGLQTEAITAFAISPELNGYTPQQSQALFARVEEEVRALPGVTGVAASMVPLLSGNNWGNSVSVEGFEAGPDTDRGAMLNEVGPGFFRTLGIPMLSGREFTPSDAAGAPRVAIVNEAFAKKFDLGRDAVGKRMAVGGSRELDIEIVGLARNAKYSEVKRQVPPLYFVPYRQDERLGSITFYVRTSLDPASLAGAIPGVVRRLDPNLPVENPKTLAQQVRENVFEDRLISTMSAVFASLATLLASIGLYGVLAYTVTQRTREIGLRMALGADGGRIRRMLLRQVALMTGLGGAIGTAAALGLGRAARAMLFELDGHDPAVFVAAVALLGLVALGAGFIPAQRASRVDPMHALRYE
jgi:predicted permease